MEGKYGTWVIFSLVLAIGEGNRTALYQEIQRRVVAEAPSVFLTHPYVLAAHAKSVRGLTLNMLKRPVDRLWGVELSR